MNRLTIFKKLIYQGDGVAAVEFALVLLPLILVAFGAIEFGLMIYNQQVITNACREGARAGIVYLEPRMPRSKIEDKVKDYAENHLVTFDDLGDPNKLLVTEMIMSDPNGEVMSNPNDVEYGDNLNVTVKYKYNFLIMPNFIPGLDKGITLTAQTIMRYE